MELHKEIVWYMNENPNKDGTYLYAQFSSDGVLLNIATVGYTKNMNGIQANMVVHILGGNTRRIMEVMHGRN